MFRLKKPTFPPSNTPKPEDKLKHYLYCPSAANDYYMESLSNFLNKHNLHTFFHQPEEHLTYSMLCGVKKYTVLSDGVYVLVRGEVVYVWTKNKHDKERKEHLFGLAKEGSYSILMQNPLLSDPLLEINYSMLVNDMFAVLECEQGNFMTIEDCVLIKLTEKALEQTNFYKIKNERIDLCEQAYLPGVSSKSPYFEVNTSLHHTFQEKSYHFRNKVALDTIGILSQGRLKAPLYGEEHNQYVTAGKYTILLPHTEYEVTTSQVTIMTIQHNPTIYYHNEQLRQHYVELMKKPSKKSPIKSSNKAFSTSSLYSDKAINHIHNLHRSELKKRKKQINIISREYENYCILPMSSCKENLSYVKKANLFNKKKEEKTKYPLVLFSVTNNRHYKGQPSFSQEKGTNKSDVPGESKKGKQFHEDNLMKRYQTYSRDLYLKFKEEKRNQHEKLTKSRMIRKNYKIQLESR